MYFPCFFANLVEEKQLLRLVVGLCVRQAKAHALTTNRRAGADRGHGGDRRCRR